MLLVAIAAVHRPGAIGLEGNLTCLSALCAGGIVHLSRAAAKAAPVAASISFHFNSLTFGIDSMNRSYYKTSYQTRLIRRSVASIQLSNFIIYSLVKTNRLKIMGKEIEIHELSGKFLVAVSIHRQY
jgi:hypothetical protein